MTKLLLGSALLYKTGQKKQQKTKLSCLCVCVVWERARAGGYKLLLDSVGLLRSQGTSAASLATEHVKINMQFFFLFSTSSLVVWVSRFYLCESRLSNVALLTHIPLLTDVRLPRVCYCNGLRQSGMCKKGSKVKKKESLSRRQRCITYVSLSEPPGYSELHLRKYERKLVSVYYVTQFLQKKLPNEKVLQRWEVTNCFFSSFFRTCTCGLRSCWASGWACRGCCCFLLLLLLLFFLSLVGNQMRLFGNKKELFWTYIFKWCF